MKKLKINIFILYVFNVSKCKNSIKYSLKIINKNFVVENRIVLYKKIYAQYIFFTNIPILRKN